MGFIHERRTRDSRLLSRYSIITFLRFFWVVVVIWCEFGVFFYSLSDCKWPDKELKQTGSNEKPTRVLLISDPQLLSPIRSRTSWFRYGTSTRYLRKGWSVVTRLHPHAVVWLGDLLASGRYVTSDDEYEDYVDDFKRIFPTHTSIPNYFVPGNTDLGLGESSAFSQNARKYFTKYFGPLNQEVTLAGHRFVFIDAPGLVDEDYRRHGSAKQYDAWTPVPGGPVDFVTSIAIKTSPAPIILFSHIPLSRPASTSCGPLREKGTSIRAGAGHGYQNLLGKQTTKFLLNTLRPAIVFSGDNRDYCNITHQVSKSHANMLEKASVREVTVKSFSPSRHIRRPGFQILSLIPPDSVASPDSPTFADALCLLPDTFRIFSSIYLPALLFTAVALLYLNISFNRHRRRFSTLSPISVTRNRPASPPPGTGSDIWSMWSPYRTREQMSPTSVLPPSARVPTAKEIFTFRASSSAPGSPHDSPLLSPIPLFHTEHQDEMNPAPYSSQYHNDHAWPSGEDAHDAPSFLPSPSARRSNRRWSWSWNFMFGGRRRQMMIMLPTWGELIKLVTSMTTNRGKRRGLAWRLMGDSMSVALPAVVTWALIGWLFF